MEMAWALACVAAVFLSGWYIGRRQSSSTTTAVVLAVTRRVRADLEGRAIRIETSDESFSLLFQEDVVLAILDRIDAAAIEHVP